MPDILARRTFGEADQRRFADLSGDHNPMHMDPIAARRTQAGRPVVHGVHTLLWALEMTCRADPALPPPVAIRADFLSFLPVGAEATLIEGKRPTVESNGVPILSLDLHRTPATAPATIPPSAAILAPQTPLALDLSDIAGRSGAVAFASDENAAAAAFPAASRWLGARRVAALLACTRLVGMVCPGLHSIFHRLDVDVVAGGEARIDYAASTVDPRFRRAILAISGGGLAGTLVTSVRQPPVAQASIAELAPHVPPGAFAGATALVVGGSRGLGEVTAKLLAAGGAAVLLGYASGRDDAARVADEIGAWGGSCRALRYDASGDPAGQLRDGGVTGLTHCYYFATPPIFGASALAYDAARFDRFRALYVDGFAALCEVLVAAGDIGVYYPSSVAVAERPAGMGEYAMAKAAGEILCEEIARRHRTLRIVTTRLPRLATDQTATLIATEDAAAVDILLPVVRRVQGVD